MKKILFATTAIVLSAGVAAAQNVTFDGTARAGLSYLEDRAGGTQEETQVNMRLRFNINAAKELDNGATVGGRIRLQYDQGRSTVSFPTGQAAFANAGGAAALNAAYVYASFGGFRVEVGNANNALDSTKLLFASEIGYIGESFGNSNGSFAAYNTGSYADGQRNRMGLFASYSLGDGTIRASYLTPDQATTAATNDEFSMSADYVFGAITVSGGFALDGNFRADNDVYFIGGQYAVMPTANVGLLVHHVNAPVAAADSTRVTLYGNYGFGATTLRGYVANDDAAGNATDVAFGLGADYDLGGATLAGGIERGYSEEIRANLGMKFSF